MADGGIVVSSEENQLYISGVANGKIIEVYNVGGTKVKEVKVCGENTTIYGLQSGNIYIIKQGDTKVKVVM